jgi:hypothetical protein
MKIDMSRSAISARLQEFSQVWRLCMTLKNSRVIVKVEPIGKRENRASDRNQKP